ncbi:MAG: bifunctional phosphoserine phosphatase/homoserine phosphotransferase ThrH [Deltaproteobacteria bacterium]|nr:bifunctional phosphoserine phosphatase/homoserine phosphotransferase ThrH [Deltaproteobacteria bacterium]MBW2612254.1 bifunctional phosphoserine phosphatase/homoserine phosphotransferase ThrH [Deltaproteobacteria bacterium]MBW2678707.1 bifunctional phosphoserine phosphatase/homoserine phosphotransferase ThrH [Deltaproteobacteria bacterium]
MKIICADMEGIFTPEIWIKVAEKTGIEELRLTTRDISDYDVLMKKRLGILKANGLKLKNITDVIQTMDPLEGAFEFLEWMRSRTQVIVVSDTYVEFAKPLLKKLGWPTLFCNSLTIDEEGSISDYNLRQKDGKRKTVLSLKQLKFEIIAVGDSYNDITMLKEADEGILFNPPDNVREEYPELPATYNYGELKEIMDRMLSNHEPA